MFVKVTVVLFIGSIIASWLLRNNNPLQCIDDYEKETIECKYMCKHGQFSLHGMKQCHPWLSCMAIEEIELTHELSGGAVKQVFVGKWRDFSVAVMKLRTPEYREDFFHGLEMLTQFQSSKFVTQLVGRCDSTATFVTEFHRHGSADRLIDLLQTNENLAHHNSCFTRLALCINYVEIISWLHGDNDDSVRRVFCDSNSLEKTLQQFLVTANLRLVVNDLDALPEVNTTSGIKCGRREIVEDFAAPEQLWPFPDRDFDDSVMVSYDEKVDVWKIPEVCSHFLNGRTDCRQVVYKLFKIHNRCKETDPSKRPAASEVLLEYRNLAGALN